MDDDDLCVIEQKSQSSELPRVPTESNKNVAPPPDPSITVDEEMIQGCFGIADDICKKDRPEMEFDPDLIMRVAAVAQTVITEKWYPDLEAFATHAKRQVVGNEDLTLLFRNNPDLLQVVNENAKEFDDPKDDLVKSKQGRTPVAKKATKVSPKPSPISIRNYFNAPVDDQPRENMHRDVIPANESGAALERSKATTMGTTPIRQPSVITDGYDSFDEFEPSVTSTPAVLAIRPPTVVASAKNHVTDDAYDSFDDLETFITKSPVKQPTNSALNVASPSDFNCSHFSTVTQVLEKIGELPKTPLARPIVSRTIGTAKREKRDSEQAESAHEKVRSHSLSTLPMKEPNDGYDSFEDDSIFVGLQNPEKPTTDPVVVNSNPAKSNDFFKAADPTALSVVEKRQKLLKMVQFDDDSDDDVHVWEPPTMSAALKSAAKKRATPLPDNEAQPTKKSKNVINTVLMNVRKKPLGEDRPPPPPLQCTMNIFDSQDDFFD